ncbi:Signal transduction histidine kinase [Chitinophaga terrae (ex Kim and Jung 2007)]|uniref:histidine kinase n=1 Tax=Chitinophaga terrae (ex Kim and Jung 2007) TaxID=408074 RepID=A0A1H4CAR3_9BACT|nr:HAMP domain-containing sensor histidine kinase [Chitinophaga terrae (ex Kim and Jung 2007)]MDQ0110087.1 signal transduction histidine kinase [Chitinophaga terrae (ex Kim and Jung 2007)]GEP88859.1 two-component sensor histidine kinase [Chitinophaga terrae (ex Kim and Jung 2007)]SEA57525.1 Signal transduction histidine kinase [Chitinophaga terrae (ex Kim and Jung 2007)]
MKIKYKIALYYTLSATLMLIAFAGFAYYFSAKSRKAEYLERLEYRARSIANVIIEDGNVKVDLLRKLDRTTFQDLYKETILVYNPNYDLLYSNLKDTTIRTNQALLTYIKENKLYSYDKGNGEVVGVYYTEGTVSVIVIVASFDKYGFQNLQNLRRILLIEALIAIGILVGVGYFFARKMVQPIDKLVEQVDSINANNLQDTQVAVKGKDEISKLGANFNTMLQRLSESFHLQKSFVSNASHELRTPLAAIISQLQVTLSKERSKEEYLALLTSLLEDAENLSDLSNGLLQLAQSEMRQEGFAFTDVRIDELLLEMPTLIRLKQKNTSKVDIHFVKVPDNDSDVTCHGNENLLKVLFLNLIDNACKFSDNNTAIVTIDFFTQYILVQVKDTGIGIPPAEINKIFEPFYRGQNALQIRGHGLGLSICKKIVQLHNGHITVTSTSQEGTTFTVMLPHL